jgi:16S rRNA processing protein RimM
LEDLIRVGVIINTFGVKGEVKIYPDIDYFDELKRVFIKDKEYKIEKLRDQKGIIIAKFEGIDDINQIESLKNSEVMIALEDRPELPEGKHYVGDLLGLEVITEDGQVLGTLDNIYNTGANDIYEVGEILLPATDEVIKQIDMENKKIIVHLLKGLI